MKSGDVRYFKHPDVWGSPIERAVIIDVGKFSSLVDVDGRITTVPNYMLFKFATLACEWAERQKRSIGQSIFGAFNQKRQQADFNFTAPKPFTPKPFTEATGTPVVWVVKGNGGSLVVLDSQEAAEATVDWLFTTTGQRCTIRTSRIQTTGVKSVSVQQ